jgi:hypothetical protein
VNHQQHYERYHAGDLAALKKLYEYHAENCVRAAGLTVDPDAVRNISSWRASGLKRPAAEAGLTGFRTTAPVKANQRLTVADPRPRRHWVAKVISATGKPGRGRKGILR